MGSAKLQELRDSFEIGDTVMVTFRKYGDRPSSVREGVIIEKETAMARVKFDTKTEKIAYSKLARAANAVARGETFLHKKKHAEPNQQQHKHPPLRVVPPAFSTLEKHIEIVDAVGETVPPPAPKAPPEPIPMPPPAPTPDPAPPEPLPAEEPPPDPPTANKAAAKPASSDLVGDLQAWIEMGSTILDTLRETESQLRAQAEELAAKAEELMAESDEKITKADQIAKQIALVDGLQA